MFLRKIKCNQAFKNFIYGIILGFSIMIPGLSGSTIAITLKLYDKIIYSLSNLCNDFKKSFKYLFPLVIGGIIGLLFGVILIKLFINSFPFYLISYFSGLMIGSYPILINKIKDGKNYILLIIGFLVPIILSLLSLYYKNQTNDTVDYSVLSYINFIIIGILLAITQLVPGLSATVLLMVIGYYNYYINIVNINLIFNYKLILVILMTFIGLILGILLFSKIINNLLTKYENRFMNLICGLSLSSIFCVYLDDSCISFYTTLNKNNFLMTILIWGIVLILGILSITYILDFLNKNKE